jgi:hypothetical protein
MRTDNIPNLKPLPKPKRCLSPRALGALAILREGGSCKRLNNRVRLFNSNGTKLRWFAASHLQELHSFGLIEATCYVAHAPTEWTLTAFGRVTQ